MVVEDCRGEFVNDIYPVARFSWNVFDLMIYHCPYLLLTVAQISRDLRLLHDERYTISEIE